MVQSSNGVVHRSGRNPKHAEWVKSYIALLEETRKYAMEYHTTGLAWNTKVLPSTFLTLYVFTDIIYRESASLNTRHPLVQPPLLPPLHPLHPRPLQWLHLHLPQQQLRLQEELLQSLPTSTAAPMLPKVYERWTRAK